MNRENRRPILEPLILISKQRTGIATILGIILVIVLSLFDVPKDIIQYAVGFVFLYVAGQKYVDAKEASSTLMENVENIVGEIIETDNAN